MLQKTAKNILWSGECSCLQHWNHLYSCERITQTIGIPSRIRKISQWNKCSTYLRNWCPNKMRSMEWKQTDWENSSWKYLSLIGDGQSHQSSAHKGLRLFRFCTVSWKVTREPRIKRCMGTEIGVVEKYTGIQNFGQNWWWANRIRVEYLPRIQYVAAQSRSRRVYCSG